MTSNGFALAGVLMAAEQGATIITANKRSSRSLLQAYDRRQAESKRAWTTPDILSWDGFVLRCWNELVYSGVTSLTLLNATQERALWARIVGADSASEGLLNLPATAENAQRAGRLVRAYRVPLDGSVYQARPETAAFAAWVAEFERECEQAAWIDEASVADIVCRAIREGRLPVRRKVLVVGFDQMTPQQRELLDALASRGADCHEVEHLREEAAEACVAAAEDTSAEIKAAANWARHKLEASPGARIGVIVPDLEDSRSKLESVFLSVLQPDLIPAGSPPRRRAFEISLGRPLSEYPVVHTALLAIRLAATGLSLSEAGVLLRSPFLSGAEQELALRADLDARLRQHRVLEVSLAKLALRAHKNCPILVKQLDAARRKWPAEKNLSPREWAEAASAVLDAIGWPNAERSPSSDEHQAVAAWADLLSDFGSLEAMEPSLSAEQFCARLLEFAEQRVFEPEKLGAPIQVMGLLEAAGSEFDHVWVMGLHDATWPAQAAPTPYIPISLQARCGVPHACPAAEVDFARRVRDRLLHSAGEIVFSHPRKEGDADLRRSPLLDGFPARCIDELAGEPLQTWSQRLFGSCELQAVCDETGPSIADGVEVRGGTRILEFQSACPFRAFFELRLGAREMESPQPGLDNRQRGDIVHRAMENLWRKLKTRKALVECANLPELVGRCAEEAIEKMHTAGDSEWEIRLARIERDRVTDLILQLLRFERERKDFTVLEPEQDRLVSIGGLRIKMKTDRVDAMDDGRRVLIDYKTGEVDCRDWEGERPLQPQLPAYAATTDGEIAAVAFAQLKVGKVQFHGYSPDATVLPCSNDFRKTQPGVDGENSLGPVVQRWKEIVERLATDYRQGRAPVDRADEDVCKFCALPAICRVEDDLIQPEPEEADDEQQ